MSTIQPTVPIGELGAYFRQVRQGRGLLITDIAARAGISGGTISRLETGRSGLSLFTTYRLCRALDLSLADLCETLGVTGLLPRGNASHPPEELTAELLGHFIELSLQNPAAAREQVPGPGTLEWEIGDSAKIWVIYCNGGVITQFDLGVYIRRARIETTRPNSLRGVAPKLGHSHAMLFRLESGYNKPARIMFDDLFKIGQALGVTDKLLPMAWAMAEFYAGLPFNLESVDWRLVELYVLAIRGVPPSVNNQTFTRKEKGGSC